MSRSAGDSGGAHEREEARLRKLAGLRARLHEQAQALRTPQDWERCLNAAARMPAEDFANILLISSQQPAASMVRGYQAWQALGRQVSKNEKGIETFSASGTPRRERPKPGPGEPQPGWRDAERVARVWDISQTSGRAIPAHTPLALPGQADAGLWDALCWLARREGFTVEREHGCPDDGVTMWTARRIRVRPGPSEQEAAWALAHQIGHVLLHNLAGYPPGATTSGCAGVRRAEADSVAFIICARHGITAMRALPYPVAWAGSDPRAQPPEAILATGERATAAAALITRHLDRILHGEDPAPAQSPRQDTGRSQTAAGSQPGTPASHAGSPSAQRPAIVDPDDGELAAASEGIRRVLADAGAFYASHLTGTWVHRYLQARGISAEAAREWGIGYAPAGWTALTGHLRGLGHHDGAIEAAGLARRSSRGTLIDHFRDRVMLPVRDSHGAPAGFIGRAHPAAGPDVPKYLNSPQTPAYRKSELLFGLDQTRSSLAHGAIPVIVEGPFDAIAVTVAGAGEHAGLAPCGTALTSEQATALSKAADLRRTGVLVAFDADAAGRKAAIRAHGILLPFTGRLQSAQLTGKDPAEVLRQDGPQALRAILSEQAQPLSALVIDASIAAWERRLRDTEGPLLAMRSTAALIAEMLPPGCTLPKVSLDGLVTGPELSDIVRRLPADTTFQIMRTASRLGFDASDVLAEVARAATRAARSPKAAQHGPRNDALHIHRGGSTTPAGLARTSFPRPPLARQGLSTTAVASPQGATTVKRLPLTRRT